MTIAQVQVDAAYWQFTQDPPGPIARGDTAWISHAVPLGAGRSAQGDVRHQDRRDVRPRDRGRRADAGGRRRSISSSQAMLGAFVGILPVVIGLMFYPALRGAGPATMNFLLAMTVGLLGFLLVDTIEDALEFAGRVGGHLPGAGDGRACRRRELPSADGRGATAGRARPGLRSRPTSPSASACTIWARGWRSARPSQQARPGSALSWSWASRSTTSPKALASRRQS